MNKGIKFATPDIGKKEIKKVNDIINTRWITCGPHVHEFERRIAEMSGCDRAVAFDSCTGAMEMTLRALGIGPGDEVITTPYTYTATAEVIHNVGAKVVFVDLKEESFEMDYEKLADAITENTKAVIPVDFGGKICDYDEMHAAVRYHAHKFKANNEFQSMYGRPVIIADAAHSFGADRKGRVSGEFADFTCYSFHVLKNVTTGGEGGAVVWKDLNDPAAKNLCDAFEQKLRLLGDHGQTSRDKSNGWEYDIRLIGHNSIMTDIDAAMGLVQLDRFEQIKEKRIEVTNRYDELFKDFAFATPMIDHFGPDETSAMHLYPIHLKETGHFRNGATMMNPEAFRNYVYQTLKEAGVPCNVHYKPLPMMTAYKDLGYRIEDFPNAYKMYCRLLTIPYHTELTAEEQEYIVEQIKKAVFGA